MASCSHLFLSVWIPQSNTRTCFWSITSLLLHPPVAGGNANKDQNSAGKQQENQSLWTRWYQHNILKKPDVDPKCRLCGHFDETIDHLVSGCPELAKTEYIHRHNKPAAHMHWKIRKEFGIEVKEWWYEHEPKTVTENDSVTILWDMPIHTDRTIAANRPDIVLKNKKGETCILIDTTIPFNTNTSVKTTEKLTRYKDLEIEVEWMWGLNTTTVPVVMGALAPSRRTWKTTPTKSLAISTCTHENVVYENCSDPCGCWCVWYSKEGDSRKHQESIGESYCDRDSKDHRIKRC